MKKEFLIIVFIAVLIIPQMSGAAETVHKEDTVVSIPDVNNQFFCGYCHVLSYPKVIKKAYLSWKGGKHKDIGVFSVIIPRNSYSRRYLNIKKYQRTKRKHLISLPWIS